MSAKPNNNPKFPWLSCLFIVGVILLFVLGITLLAVSSAEAAGNNRANGCRTFNTFAHQPVSENGIEAFFCGLPSEQVSQEDSETDLVTVSTPVPTSISTEKPELPTVVPPTKKPTQPPTVAPTEKPEETPAPPICKNPQDGRDDNIGDCNAGNGND